MNYVEATRISKDGFEIDFKSPTGMSCGIFATEEAFNDGDPDLPAPEVIIGAYGHHEHLKPDKVVEFLKGVFAEAIVFIEQSRFGALPEKLYFASPDNVNKPILSTTLLFSLFTWILPQRLFSSKRAVKSWLGTYDAR